LDTLVIILLQIVFLEEDSNGQTYDEKQFHFSVSGISSANRG
jgi:hypothetical protein